ncbi:ABC transporter permease [Paenibacillus sp. YPG26]|uniref:ABC transporter permease n=1 Tax=Paenibacillus sp. YPG26 TaxID=2878915 RepID=UPI00203F2708|nr:ABC transporter permease [Paenibacillus sp. YPG26]USB33814.1 ABC transporter permease [Paenibacillus sp. YPG26]
MPMISSERLFMRRLMDHCRKQYGVIRSVIDITVALYIVIPGVLLLARLYYDLLASPPEWLTQLPFVVIPLILMLVISQSGGLILYREAADMLFLKQHERWQSRLLRLGLFFSIAYQIIVAAVLVLILTPVLLQVFQLNLTGIILLFVITAAYKTALILAEHLVQVLLSGWRRHVVKYLAFLLLAAGYLWPSALLITSPLWACIAVIGIIALAAVLAIVRLRLRGTFLADVREDERQKTELTAVLLSGAVDKPREQKSRPWIFRKSNHLLRSREAPERIAESAVKAFYRSYVNIPLYFQFTFIGMTACYLPPFPVNVLVYLSLIILLSYWMSGYRKYFLNSRFMNMLPLEESTARRLAPPAMRLLMLPSVLLLSLSLGVKILQIWWAVPVFILVGLGVNWWVSASLWKVFGVGAADRRSA